MLLPKIQTRRCLISKQVHEGLLERLEDPKKGFHSYVQAIEWEKQTSGKTYKYNTLRELYD